MAGNRANKQKRQKQNRQRRNARSARSAHAGEATELARSGAAASEVSSSRTTGDDAGDGKAKAKAARQSVKDARRGTFTIPGQRAVLMAFLFTLVSAAMLLFLPLDFERTLDPVEDAALIEQLEDDGEDLDVDDETGEVAYFESSRIAEEFGVGVTAVLVVVPMAICGGAVWFTNRPQKQRNTAWTIAMILLAGHIFFLAPPELAITTMPPLVALAWGGFQSRRAEQKERLAAIEADRAARNGAASDVIDAEVVEESSTPAADAERPKGLFGRRRAAADADD